MVNTLTENFKIQRVSNAVAAGTTDINSSSVDMQGSESVTFVVALGAIVAGAVTSVKAQQSSDDGVADAFADLAGSAITVADDDDNQLVALEIVRPRERYVRCTVDRATQNATVDGIVALLGAPKLAAVTHDTATVVGSEVHASPGEGTA